MIINNRTEENNLDEKDCCSITGITSDLYDIEELESHSPYNETLFFMATLLGDIEEYNFSDNFNNIIKKYPKLFDFLEKIF